MLLVEIALEEEWKKWFKNKFNFEPHDTYLSVPVIDELISFRNDPLFENHKYNLNIITFEEYLKWKI